jgi:hypothetical protein
MNIELNNLNKFVCLEKIVFSNKEILTESIEFLSKNISKDYDIIICERGEGIASCFELYAIFESLLKEFGLNNKVYIFTETEVSEYYEFIKNRFGWECIFLTAFYDMPRIYQRLYNLNFPANIHIFNWQDAYKIPFDKHIEKHFLTLNRSYRNVSHEHRKYLHSFMKDMDMFDKSYASFRFLPEMYNNFGEQIQHIDDINQNQNSYSQITIKHLYDSAFLSILTESDFQSTIKLRLLSSLNNGEDERFEFRNDYLSEKTSRNLMMGLPFIMVGPYKSLDRLKNMGFKTFEMIIDESYDMEPDPLQRFEMIKNEIIKISKLSVDEMESIHKELYPILIHNRNNIKNIQDNNAKKIQSLWK